MSGTLFRHHIRVRVRIAANKARFTSPNQQIGFSTTTTKLPAPTATLPSTNSSRPGNSGTVSNAGDTTQRRGYTVGVTAQRAGSSRNLSPGDNVAPRPITPAVRRIAGSIGASREESGVITEVNSAGRKSGGRAAPLSGHGTGVREYGSSAVQGLSNGTVQPVGSAAPARVDAVVIGAGQAGLSVAYHLQKAGGLRFVTLDANEVRVLWLRCTANRRKNWERLFTRSVSKVMATLQPILGSDFERGYSHHILENC